MIRDEADALKAAAEFNEGFRKNKGSAAEIGRIRNAAMQAESALRTVEYEYRVSEDKPGKFFAEIRDKDGKLIASSRQASETRVDPQTGSIEIIGGKYFDLPSKADEWAAKWAKDNGIDDRIVIPHAIQEVRPEPPNGALYGKFIPDDVWGRMMIWDAPYSAQPDNVRAAFDKIGRAMGLKGWDPDIAAEYIYTDYLARKINEMDYGDDLGVLVQMADMEIRTRRAPEGTDPAEFDYDPRADEIASVILHDAGVPGHRFLDGETRASGWDSPDARFNVVLYSDDLGRAAWEAKDGDTRWETANGNGRVVREDDGFLAYANDEALTRKIGSGWSYVFNTIEEATRAVEQALDGQLYSRGDTIQADPIEDTTMPDARLLADQADAEIASAEQLSKGFLPAVECAMRVGA